MQAYGDLKIRTFKINWFHLQRYLDGANPPYVLKTLSTLKHLFAWIRKLLEELPGHEFEEIRSDRIAESFSLQPSRRRPTWLPLYPIKWKLASAFCCRRVTGECRWGSVL